ncbi:MAG: phosphatidylglycerophosphatase A [Pseudomonadota bacterium]
MTRLAQLAWRHPDGWLATFAGVGLAPRAPGTCGSLAALVPAWFLLALPPLAQLGVIVAGFAIGVWACSRFEARLGDHDNGAIVWDEVIGVWITLFAAPQAAWVLVAGFVLFRIFDILKPPPVSWADDRIGGGLGVMLDDVLAAVLAWICLAVLLRFLPVG